MKGIREKQFSRCNQRFDLIPIHTISLFSFKFVFLYPFFLFSFIDFFPIARSRLNLNNFDMSRRCNVRPYIDSYYWRVIRNFRDNDKAIES